MHIELTCHRGIDKVVGGGIDSQPLDTPSLDKGVEQAVGGEICRLGTHQNPVDNKTFADKGQHEEDKDSTDTAHQVGSQSLDVLPHRHLVAILLGHRRD